MRRVTTSDFQQGDWVDYSADGIRIINDIRQITRPDQDSVTIDMTIVVVCLRGKMTVTVDSKEHTLARQQVLFLQPNSVVSSYRFSDDFEGKALVFSLQTIENSIYLRRKIWDNISYLRLHPIVPLSDSDLRIFKSYYEIATANLKGADSLYKQEIVSHLLRSMVYEFLLLTDRFIVDAGQAAAEQRQTNDDDLHRRFLELLAFSHGRIRKVAQFAERLYVTPKQLGAAVQRVSGRTAIDWITEATIQAIKHDLLYTQKTVSEISDELDFPSLSFFGKFFKQHTGMSPRAFRNGEA